MEPLWTATFGGTAAAAADNEAVTTATVEDDDDAALREALLLRPRHVVNDADNGGLSARSSSYIPPSINIPKANRINSEEVDDNNGIDFTDNNHKTNNHDLLDQLVDTSNEQEITTSFIRTNPSSPGSSNPISILRRRINIEENDDDDDDDIVPGATSTAANNNNNVSSNSRHRRMNSGNTSISSLSRPAGPYDTGVKNYMLFIRRMRYAILSTIFVVVWPIGFHAFVKFQHLTDSTMHPVKGSPSDIAQKAFNAAFNSSTSVNTTTIDWNDPMNFPLLIMLDEVLPTKHVASLPSDQLHSTDISGEFYIKDNLHYPYQQEQAPMTSDPNSTSFQAAQNFSFGLYNYLMDPQYNCWKWPLPSNKNNTKNNTEPNGTISSSRCNNDYEWIHITSYYSLLLLDELPWIANSSMKSPMGDTALIMVQYRFPPEFPSRKHKPRVVELMYAIEKYKDYFYQNYYDTTNTTTESELMGQPQKEQPINHYDFSVRYTGIRYFASDLTLSTLHDIKRMDMIAIPIALVLIGLVLPSSNFIYIWIIPVIAIATTVSIWSIIMWIIAMNSKNLQLSTFTPTIMMSLSLGMGIDYTLFLLARFLEERTQKSNSRAKAILYMLQGSGHVLILSGITLAATFLGLTFLPLPMLQSVGLGASIAMISSICVNLVVVPSLLYTILGQKIIAPRNSDYTEQQHQPNGNQTRVETVGMNNVVQAIETADSASSASIEYSFHRRSRSSTSVVRFQDEAILINDNRNDGVDENSPNDTNQEFAARKVQDDVVAIDNSRDEEDDCNGATEPLLQQNIDSIPVHSCTVIAPNQQQNYLKESLWKRISKILLHPYKGVIILLISFQVLLPLAEKALHVKSSISFDLLLPAKSPSLIAYHDLERKIGTAGKLNPYRILFDGHEGNILMTSEFGFDIIQFVISALREIDYKTETENYRITVADQLMMSNQTASGNLFGSAESDIEKLSTMVLNATVTDTLFDLEKYSDCHTLPNSTPANPSVCSATKRKPTMYNGIAVVQNTRIPHAVFVSAKYCGQLKPHCPVELLHVLDLIDRTSTSHDHMATYVTATLSNVSPFSDLGIEWLIAARNAIEQLESTNMLHGVRVYIDGSGAVANDAVDAVYKAFPTMIILTSLIVFVLMGIFFKSFFPPLRSVVSIMLTLSFAFGLAVMIFQENVLKEWKFLHLNAVVSGDELCWLVPIMSFSIIVGLALDYDVFLVSRILEYRKQSYEHRTSIALGLNSTGSIIAAAGLIMAVAFGSLMFSSNPVLYQWSFILTAAVLFDTLIVRTIFVPTITSLVGPKLAWWPRKFESSRSQMICFAEYQPTLDSADVAVLLQTLEETSEYVPLHLSQA